jgi:hypothetical protein
MNAATRIFFAMLLPLLLATAPVADYTGIALTANTSHIDFI